MKRISIFGATGSIGQSTLDLIRRDKESYDVIALTGGRNTAQLAKDAIEFGAQIAVTGYEDALPQLKDALAGTGIEAAGGQGALIEAAARPTDWFMSAIVGAAGLLPGLEALKHGNTLALANKESLVTAGPLFMGAAKQYGATVLPVDSEHSAIFQALQSGKHEEVESITITASGGPFRTWPMEDLAKATVAQASTHPSWDMGQRITIDSASMFNKAMEVIEAREYFDFTPSQINVLIHPGSTIHSIVNFRDGAMMAHMGTPDMRHAIGFALHWPTRTTLPVARLDLPALGQLTFREADHTRFPALRLAYAVMEQGGHAGAVFNAAKERALDHFIDGKIGFMEMAPIVEHVMDTMSSRDGLENDTLTLETVLNADHLARRRVDDALSDPALRATT